jgi:Mor family transcriptional regulator
MNRNDEGQRNSRAKLLQREVDEIRRSPLPQVHLAKKYKVSQQTISEIVNKKTWQCASK